MKAAFFAFFFVSLIILLLSLFFYLIYLPRYYARQNLKQFSRGNQFPFELLLYENEYMLFAKVLTILSGIGFVASSGFILFSSTFFPSFSTVCAFMLISSALASMGFVFTLLLRLDAYVKLHLLAFSIFMVSSIMFDAMNILALMKLPEKSALTWIFVIAFSMFALAKAVGVLNPKLINWAKLSSTMDSSGAVTYSRPKYFPLAITEWAFIFAHFVSALFSIIAIFFVLLPYLE